jgi:hypothetical protein
VRFIIFRSLERKVRFCAGVNSERSLRSEFRGVKSSSGAKVLAVVLDVGNADSRVVDATLVIVSIVAIGF